MKKNIGTPHALKEINLAIVRKAIKELSSATRAEIVAITKISVTTVRTLLTEMIANNEISEQGFDDSIGGRKAVRYKLNKDRFIAVSLCVFDDIIRYLVVNIYGEIVRQGEFAINYDVNLFIYNFLDQFIEKNELSAIGIGVASKEKYLSILSSVEKIRKRYNVPVLVEKDLNIISFGLGRYYLKEHTGENCENINMAYIHFDKYSVGAGVLSRGRILRGRSDLAGELGLFPIAKDMTFDEFLSSDATDDEYIETVAKLCAGMCCILNPQYIAIGGQKFRGSLINRIKQRINEILPEKLLAEIVYANDYWHYYCEGIAYLTADKIFSDTVFTKEE